MPRSTHTRDSVRYISREEILRIDSTLLSADEKQFYIKLLHGDERDTEWRLQLASANEQRLRWNSFFGVSTSVAGGHGRWSHANTVALARRVQPGNTHASVTGFTDWIFRLNVPIRDVARLEIGARLEREVVATSIPIPRHSRWKLLYNGTSDSESEALVIPALQLNGMPLRGKPDLVFQERKSGELLIVEIKISNANVPVNSWPNVRAQLWAYSKVEWNAAKVTLVNEVWAMSLPLRRRATCVWDASDCTLNSECAELFDLYRDHPLSGSV